MRHQYLYTVYDPDVDARKRQHNTLIKLPGFSFRTVKILVQEVQSVRVPISRWHEIVLGSNYYTLNKHFQEIFDLRVNGDNSIAVTLY